MERTPKQRIIFDEDMYDDEFLRDYLAEDYEIYKDELDISFDEYVEHRRNEGALYDIKERDFTEEMASLRSFLDNGNPLIVSGSIGRWDGTRTGFTVYDNFDAAIDTSPSRFGGDNVFADCEIQKVWDENGHLFIHGAHHDGSVTVELRQLTDAGAVTYEAISEAWNGESFTIIGNNATDWAFKTYDGSEQSFIQAMHDLWEEPSFCQLPHYMEKEFGCPSEEWQLEPLPMEHIGFEDEISEVNGLLNFYIPVTFGVDRVFGTDVESLDNDDWLNIYANYDMAHGEVSDHLDISLNRADGSIESLTYPLDAEQRESLRQKMDAYCLEQVGKTLDDYVKEVAESEADSDAAHIADFTVGKYRVHIRAARWHLRPRRSHDVLVGGCGRVRSRPALGGVLRHHARPCEVPRRPVHGWSLLHVNAPRYGIARGQYREHAGAFPRWLHPRLDGRQGRPSSHLPAPVRHP